MPPKKTFILTGLALLAAILLLPVLFAGASAQTTSEDELELGARLYAENCLVCHGEQGQGRVGATLAKPWPGVFPAADIKTTISRGVIGSTMPAWGEQFGGPLPEAEIDALVAYILSWQTGQVVDYSPAATATLRPPITPIPQVEGDPNRGAVLYDENCTVCHGEDGQGRIGARLAKSWPSVRPDLTIRTTISQGIEGSTMPAWSMAYGGPLSEDQVDDIVSFILTMPAVESPAQPTPDTEDREPSILSGWVGVLLGVVLFALLIGIAIWAQRERE